MKTPQERFEDNYIAVKEAANNRRGFRIKYVYYGAWYLWAEPEKTVRRNKLLFALLGVVSVAAYLPAALLYTPINGSLLVGLPASLAVAAFIFEALGIVQFCAARGKLPQPDYKNISARLLVTGSVTSFLLLVSAVAAVVFMAVNGFSRTEIVVPLGYLLSGLSSAMIVILYKGMKITTLPNAQAKPKNVLTPLSQG